MTESVRGQPGAAARWATTSRTQTSDRAVLGGKLRSVNRDADAPPELVGDDLELRPERLRRARDPRLLLEPPVGVLPVAPRALDVRCHRRPEPSRVRRRARRCSSSRPARADRPRQGSARRARSPGRASANATCAWRHLRFPGDREPPIPSSSDAPPSRPVRPAASSRRMPPLLLRRLLERRSELRVLRDVTAPALDSSGSLDPRDRRDQARAGQVVRRRERLAVGAVGILLGDGRRPVRAANGYAPERARCPAELALDDREVIHPSGAYACARAASPGSP